MRFDSCYTESKTEYFPHYQKKCAKVVPVACHLDNTLKGTYLYLICRGGNLLEPHDSIKINS